MTAKKKYRRTKRRRREAGAIAESLDAAVTLSELYDRHDAIKAEAVRRIREQMRNHSVRWYVRADYGESAYVKKKLIMPLVEDYCENFSRRADAALLASMIVPEGKSFAYFLAQQMQDSRTAERLRAQTGNEHTAFNSLMIFLRRQEETKELLYEIRSEFDSETIAYALADNPRYQTAVQPMLRRIAANAALYADFKENTPDNYALFFPEARGMDRHFILHLGPTNSGKTYEAIKSMEEAESGVYLGPLRLLAYEQFERINGDGVYCSMITGEERILVDGAQHQASTIEMWNPEDRFEVAVIDEAQMIADPDRGSAWTNAILGVLADKVHVCASEDAKDCLIRMIVSCGDTFELREHRRKTPLEMDPSEFRFPDKVEKGDALIVFSRRDVHGVAADLKLAGISCSIIYGALPYDVRHREAEKFALGETDVVVATDAIGMGMNLPIRRVVFLQQDKFDGKTTRFLRATEVKQIAGRAGRYGIYDVGYVQSFGEWKRIRRLLSAELRPIEKAVIGIPEDFFDRDGNISDILSVWDSLPATQDYDKGDIASKIDMAKDLESIMVNKPLIRRFIRFSVDMDDQEVYGVLREHYEAKCRNEEPDPEDLFTFYDPTGIPASPEYAQDLETMYRVFDFLYAYHTTYGQQETLERILERKRAISEKLVGILETGYVQKRCRVCGRKIAWNYPYGVCDRCYATRRL